MVLSWKKATGMRTTWQYAYDRLEENWTAEIGISHATTLERYCSLWYMLGQPFDAHCCHTGTAIKHSVPHWVKPSFVIFDIQALWCSAECQSARMSKTTNDVLTRSGTGCFIAVPIWQQWASKGEHTYLVVELVETFLSLCLLRLQLFYCVAHRVQLLLQWQHFTVLDLNVGLFLRLLLL